MPDMRATIELEVHGMHCGGCATTVEAALKKASGVVAADVNYATERASVELRNHDADVDMDALIRAVRAAGYDAAPLGDASDSAARRQGRRDAELRDRRRRLWLAAAAGVPVIVWHFAGSSAANVTAAIRIGWGVEALLTLVVLSAAAGPMLVGAGRAALRLTGNMDLLVSLGILTALISGLIGIVAANPALILFHAAVMIVLFVSIGKYMELRARGRASSALEALLSRIPREALRVVDGKTEPVPVSDLRLGDILQVPPLSTVPVDGEIIEGSLSVNEAMLTGESLPVEHSVGDTVLGGTEALSGLAKVRATATGATSAAARIAALVEQAQASKPPWQRLADRAAAWFVPIVLSLALLTLVLWYAVFDAGLVQSLERMIAVLVVACPCAMGLAIPTAVLVGTTRAAEYGILVRDASALEAAGRIDEVLLDKTGTLTLGQPALVAVETLDDLDENELLHHAASLERFTQHPLARALLTRAKQRELQLVAPRGLRSVPGRGLAGQVAETSVLVGNELWLIDNDVDASAGRKPADEFASRGHSVAWVAIDGRVAGLLAFADPLHPEAAEAVEALRKLGVKPRIVSGDRHAAVSHIAGQLGIERFEAELTPDDKLARVRELTGSGQRVAMVGDGINDAAALAAADVGIAIGTGADVAREAADICLIGHSPRLIAKAVRVSRRGGRVMKQNLFWAIIYNVVMLPLAMFTHLPPAAATAAMMFSSLSVVANSLRLRRA